MFNNTIAIFSKIKNDIKRVCSITDILVQLVFISLYAFSVASNIGNTVRLVIFSLLLVLSISYFLFHTITIRIETKKFKKVVKKKVHNTFTYIKLAVQAFSIGFTLYEINKFGASDLTKIFTIVTMIGFAVQIILEILKVTIDYYINLLIVAVDEDTKPVQKAVNTVFEIKDNLANPKALVMKALDKPLGFFANKLTNNEKTEIAITETPQKINKKEFKIRSKVLELGKARKKQCLERKIQKEEEKEAKAELKQEQQEAILDEQIKKVKNHIGTILNAFKKNKKGSDNNEINKNND